MAKRKQEEGKEGGGEGSPSTYVVAVKQDIYRFTLVEEEGGREGEEEGEVVKEERRPRYRLIKGGPDRVFPFLSPSRPRPALEAGIDGEEEVVVEEEEEEDEEANNIVGVTLTEDGTVLVASKVREEGRAGGK